MLQRISADRFTTPAGQQVQVVLRSSRNNGTNGGAFHYAGKPLPPEVIQQLPGCTFVPVAGVEQFRVNVDFDPDAPNARYDLFEIDQANGAPVDLNERRLASDNDAIIGFGIVGVAVAVLARAGRGATRGLPTPAQKAAPGKRVAASRKATPRKKKATPGKKTAAAKKRASQRKPSGKPAAQAAGQKKRRGAVKKGAIAKPAKRQKPSPRAERRRARKPK